MRKLKAGIVGCGGIANGKHLPAMKKSGLYEIVAFCDIIRERAEKAKKEYGTEDAKVFEDYQELIKEDLDVVYVTTPNRSHAEISIAAMEAGKDVMCEKPMAKNYAEAQKMVETSEKTGRILNIGYQNRYRPDSLYLKEMCKADELGEIYFAKAHALRRRAVPTWGVFLNEEEQGGGPLIDIGTHALDLTLWMMDNYEVESVTGQTFHKLADQTNQGNAFGDWDPKEFCVEDSAFGFIRMKNGAVIELEAAWALNTLEVDEAKTSLCGTKAGADMKDGLRLILYACFLVSCIYICNQFTHGLPSGNLLQISCDLAILRILINIQASILILTNIKSNHRWCLRVNSNKLYLIIYICYISIISNTWNCIADNVLIGLNIFTLLFKCFLTKFCILHNNLLKILDICLFYCIKILLYQFFYFRHAVLF